VETPRKVFKVEPEDFFAIIGALLPFVIFFARISNDGFWVDEAISRIISSSGISNLFEWCYYSFSQSPFYYLIPLFLNELGLTDVLSMRVPSLLCLVGVLYFQLKICDELGHRKMFLPASVILFFVPGVYDGLLLARPYGLALLCLQIARWRLIRYRKYFEPSDLLLGGLTSLAAFYCHYLLIDGLLIDWILTLSVARFWKAKNIVVISLLFLLALPGLSHIVQIHRFAPDLNYKGIFQLEMISGVFASPVPYLIPIIILFSVTTIYLTNIKSAHKRANQIVWLALLGSVLPFLIKALFSYSFGLTVYIPRYLLSAGPSIALLFGYALFCLVAGVSRQLFGLLLAGFASSVAFRDPHIHYPDLSLVLQPEVKGHPAQTVLLYGGLVEANIESWKDDPMRHRYLASALTVYDENREVIILPYSVKEGGRLIKKRVMMLAGRERVLLIFLYFDQLIFDAVEFELEQNGYSSPQPLLPNSKQIWSINKKPN